MTEKSTLKKSATLAAAGLVVAGALLAGCGESKAAPMARCVRRQLGRDREVAGRAVAIPVERLR